MPRTVRLMRLAMLMTLPVLTSCATASPPTPKSSSDLVRQAVAKALADACAALKPDTLTEVQETVIPLLNYANREAESWRAFGCKV